MGLRRPKCVLPPSLRVLLVVMKALLPPPRYCLSQFHASLGKANRRKRHFFLCLCGFLCSGLAYLAFTALPAEGYGTRGLVREERDPPFAPCGVNTPRNLPSYQSICSIVRKRGKSTLLRSPMVTPQKPWPDPVTMAALFR